MGKNKNKQFKKQNAVEAPVAEKPVVVAPADKKPEAKPVPPVSKKPDAKKPENKKPEVNKPTAKVPPTPEVDPQVIKPEDIYNSFGVKKEDNGEVSLDTIVTLNRNLTDRYVTHPVKGQPEQLVNTIAGPNGIIDVLNVESIARLLASNKLVTLQNINPEMYGRMKEVCSFYGVTLPEPKALPAPAEGTLQFKDGEGGVEVEEETKKTVAAEEARGKKVKAIIPVEEATDDNLDIALQQAWEEGRKTTLGNGFRAVINYIQIYDYNHAKTDAEKKAMEARSIPELIERVYSIIPGGVMMFKALGRYFHTTINTHKNPLSAFVGFKSQLRLIDDARSVKDDSGEYVKTVYVYPFKDKEIAQIITSLLSQTTTEMIAMVKKSLVKYEAIEKGSPEFESKQIRIDNAKAMIADWEKNYEYITMITEGDILQLKDYRDEIGKLKAKDPESPKAKELEIRNQDLFMIASQYGYSSKDPETKKTVISDVEAVRDIARYIVNLFRPIDSQLSTSFVVTATTEEVKN